MGEAQRQLGVVTGASPCGVRHDKPVCLYGPLEGVTSRHTMLVWLPPTVLLKEQGRRSQFVLADTQKFNEMTFVTLLEPLTQQGKVRSWVLLGCRVHLPTFPCVFARTLQQVYALA